MTRWPSLLLAKPKTSVLAGYREVVVGGQRLVVVIAVHRLPILPFDISTSLPVLPVAAFCELPAPVSPTVGAQSPRSTNSGILRRALRIFEIAARARPDGAEEPHSGFLG